MESVRLTPSVCFIVGDNHTLHCGVKDYAKKLAEELEKAGITAEVLAPADWGMKSFLRFCKQLQRRNFDILHLQYPSIGNRKSLGPHILGKMKLARGTVVTLHEYTALPRLQRASTHLFRWTADQLVFTTETEIEGFGRSRVQQRIIPIGSNVSAAPSDGSRDNTILYFGQIRPEKGLEEFLDLARRSLKPGKPFKFQVIGSVPQRRMEYYEAVRAKAAPEVEWFIDLPFDEIARKMAASLAAYLPFPDGASNRRGSLLAALTNGLPVITKFGPATSREMRNILLPAEEPVEALAHIERLHASPEEARALSAAARLHAQQFSWAEIVRQHEQLYQQTLARAEYPRQQWAKKVPPVVAR